MEKIIAITQNTGANGAFDFGCQLAKLSGSRLMTISLGTDTLKETGEDKLTANSPELHTYEIMKNKCSEHGIEAEICVYNGDMEEALLFESRFADLLVLSRDPSFLEVKDHIPSRFIKSVLSDSECPVILAPRHSTSINEIVFCYDGSATALYAIKQFTYLFPQYHNNKVTLLEIREAELYPEHRSSWLLHHNRTQSWLKAHYTDTHFTFLEGEPSEALYHYFTKKQKAFIVMGAFGRKGLSSLLKKSSAEYIVRKIDLPLFIAHR